MNRTKIVHMTSVHSRYDTRIFLKECTTLAESGYDVSLIVADGHNDEKINNVNIYDAGAPSSRLKRMFFTTIKIFKIAKSLNSDIYHFHDPELMPLGVLLKFKQKKIIYDVHENVALQILDKHWIKTRILKLLFSKIYLALENVASRIFDAIVTATSGIAEEFNTKNTLALRNFPVIKVIDESISESQKILSVKETRLIYAGGLTRIRGIKEVIMALDYLDNVELLLFGDWESENFKNECMNLESFNKVTYKGFRKQAEVYSYMKSSDIGIITVYGKNYLSGGLPVKAFEYMACSIPFIMTENIYWKKIFNNCGIFVNPKNPREIAEKINYLAQNKKLAKEMGANGREKVLNEYSWEIEKSKLLNIYKTIILES